MRMTSLTVPAKLDSLTALGDFVAAAANLAGLSQQASYGLRLAVDEFATNAIIHGQPPTTGMLELRAELDETTLTLLLEDEGVPFDPSQFPPPDDLICRPSSENSAAWGYILPGKVSIPMFTKEWERGTATRSS